MLHITKNEIISRVQIDNNNNNNNSNSSYYNIYDQYLEEETSLRCTPLSEIFAFPDVIIDNYAAVCEFQKNREPYSRHFPHTMQQLYVHVGNYIDEYYHAMHNNSSVNNVDKDKTQTHLRAYKMHHPNDAKMMRQIIFDYYNITSSVENNNNHLNNSNNNLPIPTAAVDEQQQRQHHQKELRIPVIGFLNRKISSGRYVTNHASIVKALEEEFYPNNINSTGDVTTNPTTSSASVHYLYNFDGLSFQEQITYMNKIDILIGPHGAQLTSIPFIPECGGILELFPTGYYIPDFFGSLSRSTGHYHISYYTGNITNRVEEVLVGSQTLHARSRSRSNHINNADPNIIIYGVKKLISNWQTCRCLTEVEKDACIW
jgi:hypothetical protein